MMLFRKKDDRRKSERRLVQGAGKIRLGLGALPRDCTIIDVSDGGARVIAERLDAIPEEFTLIMPDGRARECRLAWRINCEFGVQFVDRAFGNPGLRSGRAA